MHLVVLDMAQEEGLVTEEETKRFRAYYTQQYELDIVSIH